MTEAETFASLEAKIRILNFKYRKSVKIGDSEPCIAFTKIHSNHNF